MDAIGVEEMGPGLDPAVNTEESENKEDETKETYKSYKKKYRKMKYKFDDAMTLTYTLYTQEQKAEHTAKRLALENDQLLDLLLDINKSAQIPADKRIDLSTESPFLAPVPDLVTKEELARAGEINTPEAQKVYNKMLAWFEEKEANKATRPAKSLTQLMATTPHLTSNNPLVSRDTLSTLEPPEGWSHPIGYLTPDQIDNFYDDLEKEANGEKVPPPTPEQEAAEAERRNPNSVTNWLRKHEPKVFLQDGEGSEKSNGKPGSLRGAGKRASMPAPSKPDALEIVEEDGLGYDPTIGGLEPTKGGKRKREKEDDGGYHPKLGAPDGKMKRPRPKKKKTEGPELTASSTPKEKKARNKSSRTSGSGDTFIKDEPTPSEFSV